MPDLLELVAARPVANAGNKARRQERLSLIEDFLFIGGPGLPVREAATRLGVTTRTVERIRAELRQVTR